MITGIILSAGASARMGRCKALLEKDGKTFLEHVLGKLSTVCDKIIIVTGAHHNEIRDYFSPGERLKQYNAVIVENKQFKNGMFSSLQTGIAAARESDWLLYHFVDQPGLQEDFYTGLVEQIDETKQWIQPAQNNRRGHPILIRETVFPLLLTASPHVTMRDALRDIQVIRSTWEYSGPGLFDDVDTPEDYQRFIS